MQIKAVMDHMPSSNLRPEDEEPESEEQMQQEYMRRQQAMIDGGDEGAAAASSASRVYRMTMLFSATMPPRVEALAKTYLRHPVFISVGDRSKAASRVEQRVEWILSEGAKKNRLLELVQQSETPIIIFTNLKQHCDSIHRWLSAIGMGSEVLHGGKSQVDRMTALANFKDGKVPVLVATDVAGRGLDVQGVKHVINYDLPSDIEKYTHRIGRTGRAGLTGLATSFLLESDTDIMYDLTQILRASNQPVPPQLAAHEASKFKPGTVPQDGPGGKPKGGGHHGGGGGGGGRQ
jgi:ATP-dependent RNA helicase DDX23/PRP28